MPASAKILRAVAVPLIRGAAVLLAVLLFGSGLRAEHTRHWRQSNFDEFEKGNAKGVALRSDGFVLPAPRFAPLVDPSLAYLWDLRADSKGNLYAAGGSNAKVVRIDAAGKSTTVFESNEMAAQALAFDSHDTLFVGTSPDGKVYRVPPGGEKSVYFEPKTKYIWALALDKDGTLYVATGDKGEIYSVAPDGKGQLFYSSEEAHIRSLAFDAQGNLLAGTEPDGLILRISKSGNDPKTRQAFVLYETSKKEVTALLLDRSGAIFAAAIGEKRRAPLTTFTPPAQQAAQQVAQIAGITTAPPAQQQQIAPFVPFPTLNGSAVYRIAPDGQPQEIWAGRDELVYALGFSASGKLLIGTGNHGMVVQLDGENLYSNLAKTESSQVTGFVSSSGGKVFVATANPGKVFALGPDYETQSSFESQTFDAKIFTNWGRLTWWGENGANDGRIEFFVRSGNTSNPENNWSPWAGPYRVALGEKVAAPPARFVQWKAVFRAPAGGPAPDISWVDVAYLPKNVAPEIEAIVIQNPGIRLQSFQAPATGQTPVQPVQLRMPPSTTGIVSEFPRGGQQQSAPPPSRFEPPPQGFAARGHQAVLWSARDENDDELVYTIYYRGEGEKNWKLLKDRVEHRYYSWDTTTMPDGAYYLKIVASDAPSNPPDEALTAERESDRFVVDNTPPVVENLRAEAGTSAASASLRFDARDAASAIARAEYSLDGGDWKILFPQGRLSDSLQASYALMISGLSNGEHTFAVRVFDHFENTASAKVTFTVPVARR